MSKPERWLVRDDQSGIVKYWVHDPKGERLGGPYLVRDIKLLLGQDYCIAPGGKPVELPR